MNKLVSLRFLVLALSIFFISNASAFSLFDYEANIITVTNSNTRNFIPTISDQPSTNLDLCEGETLTLSVTASGTGELSYTWTKGGVIVSNGGNVSGQGTSTLTISNTTLSDAGNYVCEISDDDGTTTSATSVVTVNSKPTLSITGNNTLCVGELTSLTVSGAVSYQWSTGSTSPTISISPSVSTQYTVEGTNANGCKSVQTFDVVVNSLPNVVINGNLTICESTSTTLTASGALTYDWGSGFSNTASNTVFPTTTTTYAVVGRDSNGCEKTSSVEVTVNPIPTASVSSDSSTCAGEDAIFTITGTPDAVVQYNLNSGTNTSVSLGSSGTYTVTVPTVSTSQTLNLTEVTQSGCQQLLATSSTITLNSEPELTVSGDSTICISESTTLSVSGAASYQWSTGSTSSVITVNPIANTTYTVTGFSADGCEATTTFDVIVNPLPNVLISGNLTICESTSTTLSASGAQSYDWGSGFSPTSALTVSPTSNTIYTVVGKDANGCENTSSVEVIVNPIPTASVSSNANVCQGEDAIFTISGTPNAQVSYTLNGGSIVVTTLNATGNFNLTIPATTTTTQTLNLIEVSNLGCQQLVSESSSVIVDPIPLAPSVSNPSPYCLNESTTQLTASGANLKWYVSPLGGSSSTIAPTPDSSFAGTFSYYVSQTVNGCESERSEIQVVINSLPALNISGDTVICQGGSTTLSVSGAESYDWGLGFSINPDFNVTPTTTTTYTVIGRDSNGCESSSSVEVIVNDNPTASISNAGPICTGESADFTLTGTPNSSVVYSVDGTSNQTEVLNGSGQASVSIPNVTSDITIELLSVSNSQCQTALTNTFSTVIVNPAPSAPVVTSPKTYCLNESTTQLTASSNTGNNLNWYSFDNSPLSAAPTPDTSSAGALSYFVSQTNAFGCESTRSEIVVVINPEPLAPTVTATVNYCQNDNALPLDTSGVLNPKWYDASTGGNFLGTVITPPTNTTGNFSYYVSETIDNCEGPRTQVSVNINSFPVAPTVTTPISYCQNDVPSTLSASATTGGTLKWYLSPTGDDSTLTPPTVDTSAPGSTSYYVSETNILGCEGERAVITVTVSDTPTPPENAAITNPSCTNPTGSITLDNLPSGIWTLTNTNDGTTITDSSTSYTVSNLNPGTYSFTVAIGQCVSEPSSSVTIGSVPTQSAPVVETITQPTCTVPTGAVTFTGLPALESWTLTQVGNGSTTTGFGTSTAISGLSTGAYNFTLTNADGCESSASSTIVIDAQPPTPSAPIANAQSFISSENATISDLEIVSSGTPVWYNQLSGGTAYATTDLLVSGTYYASQINVDGCESINRTAVSISVFQDSVGGIVSGTTTVCSGINSTVLSLSGQIGDVIRWESSPVSDFLSDLNSINNTGVTYTVQDATSSLYYRAVVQSGTAPEAFSSPAFVDVTTPSVGGTLTAQNTAVCENIAGGLLTLNGETGTILNWQETTDNGASWTIISNTASTYEVPALTQTTQFRAVVQNGSCPVDFSNTVQIDVRDTPSITDIPNQAVCLGDTVTFGQPFVANNSYSWYSNLDVDPSIPFSNLNEITINFDEVNTQIFTYRITDTTTGCFVEDSFEVVTNPLPSAEVIADTSICEGLNINLGVSSVLGNSYSWSSNPVGFTSSSSNPSVAPIVTTVYTLTETTPQGCEFSNQVTITVQPEPLISIVDAPQISICENQTDVQLQATVSNYETNSISWSSLVGDGDFDFTDILNPKYTPSTNDINTGFAVVQLSVVGLGPCAQTYTQDLTINIDSLPVANAGSDAITCGTTPVIIDASATLNAASVVWSLPSGITGTLDTSDPFRPIYTPSEGDINSGSVVITMEAFSGNTCPSDQDQMEVFITPPPVVDIGPISARICEDENYTFPVGAVTVANTIASTHTWSNGSGDGIFTSTALTPTYIPGENDILNGLVTLTFTATGNDPCFTPVSDTFILNIVKKPTVNAGPDRLVCEGPVQVTGAVIENPDSILWTIDPGTGNGYFVDPTAENPVYIPDASDLNTTVTFIVTVNPINSCGSTVSDSALYTINAAPTVVAGADATICETNTSYQLQSTVSDAAEINWISSGSGEFDNNSIEDPIYTLSPNDINNGTVSFTVTVTQPGCASTSDTMVLTIQKNPIANAGLTQQICEGEFVTIPDATAQFSDSYSWTQNGGVGSFINTSTLAPTYTSVAGESGTVILTLTADPIAPCTISSSSQTEIVITAKPVVDAGNDAQICEGESYTINSATAINTSGLQWTNNGGDGVFLSGSETTLTPTYVPGTNDNNLGTVTLSLVGSKNFPCNTDAQDSMVITINKIPTIDIITPSVDLCVDTPNFQITDLVVDHYDNLLWETSGTGNFGGLETSENPTYFPTPADYELGIVTLTLTASKNPLNCNSSTQGIITLNFIEIPTVDAGPASVSLCEGFSYVTDQAIAIDYSTLTWSSSGTGTFSTANPNNLLETYTPSQADYDAGVVILTLEANSNAPCTALVTDTIQLDLQKTPVITVPSTTSICEDNNSFDIGGVSITPANAYDSSSVAWTSTGTGSFTSSGDILNPIYNPSAQDFNTGTVTLTISVDPIAPCATSFSDSFVLNFDASPIADAGIDLIQCDEPFQILTASYDNTTVDRIEWSNGTSDGIFDADNIIDPVYTPGTADIASGSVTLTLTAFAQGDCSSDVVTTMEVSFVNSPSVVVVTPQNPICQDETNVPVLGTVISDTDTILWTSATGTTVANPETISPIVTPSALDIANGFIDLTITASPNAPCATPVTQIVRIPIQDNPELNPGASQIICEGEVLITSDAFETNVTNLTWSNSGGDGTFNTSINAIVTEYQPGLTEIANGFVELVVTADAVAPCSGTISRTVIHSITRNPSVTLDSSEETICESQTSYTVPLDFVTIEDVTSVDTIQWTTSGDSSNLSGASTLTPTYSPTSADITAGYVNLILTVTPVSPCTDQIIETLKLNIEPSATIDFSNDGFFCEGEPKQLSANFNNYDSDTINWTIIDGTGQLTAANTASPTFIPDSDSANVTIRISVRGLAPCDEVVEQDFTISAINTPEVMMTTTSDTVCSSELTYNLTGNTVEDPTNTLQWTRVNPVGTGIFSSSTDLNPSYTFSADDIANGFVVLRLTATSAAPCSSTDFEEITIQIDPAPTATISSQPLVCAEEPYTATALNPDNNTLSWTEINGNHGSFVSAGANNVIFNQLAGNDEDFEIQLTSTTTLNCLPLVESVVVVVQPKPTIDVGAAIQNNCSSEPFQISGVTASNQASILWTIDGTGSSVGFSDPTELNPTFTPSNSQVLAGQVVLKVTATAEAICGSAFDVSDTITLNFDTEQTVSFTAPVSICEGDTISLVGLAPNSSSVAWSTSSTTSTSGFSAPNALNSIYTPSAQDLIVGAVTLTLTGTSDSNCPDATYNLEILIDPKPEADAGATVSICEGTTTYQVNDANAQNYDSSVSTNINWSLTGPGSIQAGTQNTLTPVVLPTPGATGDIVLTLEVNGYPSCNTTVTSTKTITIQPSPSVIVPVTKTICEGEDLILSASEVFAFNYSSVSWSSSNGLGSFLPSNDVATIYTPTAGQTGTVNLILTANEATGTCPSASQPIQLEIIPNPVVDAGAGASICVTDTYTVVGASIQNYQSFTWSVTGPAEIISGEATLTPVIVSDAGATGTAIVTLTATGDAPCPVSISDDFILEINPTPIVNAGPDGILCEGTSSYQLSGSVNDAVASTSYSWTVTNGGGSLQTTANPLEPIYIPGATDFNSATGSKIIQFSVTATSTNGCATSTDFMELTVFSSPVIDAGVDILDVCEGTDIILSTATASNYSALNWSSSGNGTFDYSSSTINPTYSLGSDDVSTVTLTLTAMPNASCDQVAVQDQVTVNVVQNVSLTLQDTEISVCGDTFTLPDLVDITNASSILWTNVTGASGTPSVPVNATSETPSLTPSSDEIANGFVLLNIEAQPIANCSTPMNATLRVNLQPEADVEAGNDVFFCEGEVIIVSGNGATVTNAATYEWTHNGTGTIEPTTVSTLNPKYNPGTNETGVITLTLEATNVAPCSGVVSDSITLTIQSLPTVTAGPDFTICESSNINITNAAETDADSILWTSSQNSDGTSSGSYTSGTFNNNSIINPTYIPSQDDIDLGMVYLTVTTSNLACGVPVNDVIKVTISDGVSVYAGQNATICEDESYALINATSETTDITWISSDNSSGSSSPSYQPGSFSSPTALNASYFPSVDDINRGYVYLILTGTGDNSCPVDESSMKLNITKKPTVSANDISMCVSSPSVPLNASATDYNTLTWSLVSGPGRVENGVYYTDLTDDITTSQTATIRAIATPLSGCASNAEQLISINIQPLPAVEAGESGIVCYLPGEPIDPFTIIGTSVTNASSINWSTNGALSGNFNLGDPVIYESYSNNCIPEILTLSANGVGACSTETASDSVTLTINCTVSSLGAISGDDTVCQDASNVVYTVPVDSNVVTYNWQVPTGATIVSGQGTNSITVDFDDTALSGDVTVNGENGCGIGPSSALAITIDNLPTATAISGPQTVCEGETYTYTASIINNATSYVWTLPNGSEVTTATNTISIPFSVGALSGNLSVQGLNFCGRGVSSVGYAITVQSQPVLSGTLTPAPVCSEDTFNYTPSSTSTGATFTWTRAIQSGISNPIGTGTGVINEVLVNTTTSVIPVDYLVSITSLDGCTNDQIITVNVNPIPTLTSVNPTATICSGNTFSYTPTSSEPGSISWSRTAVSGILEGSSSGLNTISETLTNTTDAPLLVSYSLTLPANSFGCTGPEITFDLVVNPEPTIDQVPSQAVCSGESIGINFSTTNTGGLSSYSWTNDNSAIGLALSGTTDNLTFTAINSTTISQEVNISVTPIFDNGGISCSGTPMTFTITVNPEAQVDPVSSQVVCNNDLVSSIGFTSVNTPGTTTYEWTNDNTTIGLGATGQGSIPDFIAINSSGLPQVATLVVTPSYSYNGVSCTGIPETFSIIVNPTAQVNSVSDLEVCNGELVSPINFDTSNTNGITTYTWTNDNTSIGLSSGATGAIPAFTSLNTSGVSQTATITVTPSYEYNGQVCSGPAEVFTITVNPTAQVNPITSIEVCDSELIPAIDFGTTNTDGLTAYSWTNDNTAIGLSASSGVGSITPFTAINTTTAPMVATIVVTPTYTNNGIICVGPVEIFTITVNPSAIMDQPLDQVVCDGDTVIVDFTTSNTIGTTTYDWTNSNTSIGLLNPTGNGSFSFVASNTGTTPLTSTLKVIPTFTNGGVSCVGEELVFTITVNPIPQVNPVVSQVLCNGESTFVDFETLNTAGTTTYSWTNDTPSIGIAANGEGSIPLFTVNNSGNVPIVANLTVTPTYTSEGVSCTGSPENFTITVNPSAQVDLPSSTVVCNGDSISSIIFSTANLSGITTYEWTNSNPSIGLAASGSGDILGFVAQNTGLSPEIATLTVTPLYSDNGVDCLGDPEVFTITVNPTAQVNPPSPQVLCNGETSDLIFTTLNTLGVTSYSWTNDNPSIGLNALGTGSVSSFVANNTTDSPITATLVVTPTFTYDGVSCSGPSESFTITVNPSSQVDQPVSETVCNGDTTTVVNFISTNLVGITTYEWVNSNATIGLPSSGTGPIPSFTAINNGLATAVATITVTPYFEYSGTSCSGPSKTFTITVNPDAQVDQPSDTVICNGDSFDYDFTTSNVGGIVSYDWTNNNPSIGLAANGTGPLPTFTAINTGVAPEVAMITVSPTYTQGFVSCPGNSKTFTITVNPSADVVVTNGDQTICHDEPTTSISFGSANNPSITSYEWTNDNPSIGLAALGNGNISSFIGINTGTIPEVANITVTPIYNNGGLGCAGPTETFTITVNPSAQVEQPLSQVVCNGDNTNLISFASINTAGATSFDWFNDNTSIGLPSVGNGDILPFVAVNSGVTPEVATITVTPTFSNNGVSCAGPSQTFTITVNPSANMTPLVSQSYCYGSLTETIEFTTINALGTTTYSWTNNNTTIGLGAAGVGAIPPFTTVNASLAPVTATITVTPTFTYLGVACDGAAQDFTITVNPQADLVQPNDFTICDTEISTPVSFSTNNLGGIVSYSWVNDNPAIGLGTNGLGSVPSFTAVNSGLTVEVATISVTAFYGNAGESCADTKTFTITVNPSPDATITGENTYLVCENDEEPTVTFTGSTGVAPYTFDYQINGGTVQQISSSGSSDSATVSIPTDVPGTYIIELLEVTDSSGFSCASTAISLPNEALVEVQQKGTIEPTDLNTVDQVVCEDVLIDPIVFTIGGSATNAYATGLPSGVTTAYNPVAGTLTVSGAATIIGTFDYTIYTSGSPNGCNMTYDGTLVINSDDVITVLTPDTVDQELCECEIIAPISYDLGGGATGGDVTFTSGIPAGILWSIDANVLTITGASCDVGVFDYVVNSYGICNNNVPIGGTIEIKEDSTVSLLSGDLNTTVCVGSAIATPVQFEITPLTSALLISPPPPPGITFNSTTGILSGTPTQSGVYEYTINSNTGCSNTLSGTININPDQEITYLSGDLNQIACQGTPIDPLSFTVTPGVDEVSINPALPDGITFDVNLGVVTIFGTPTAPTGLPQNYIITTIGDCGTASTSDFVMEVRPEANLTVVSDPATIDQSVCQGVDIEPIVFTIDGGVTGIETPTLPDGLIWFYDAATNQYIIQGSPTNFGTFNFTISTSGCVATQQFSVTNTNNNVSITLTSPEDSDDQLLCQTNFTSPITPIVYAITGVTGVDITGLPLGVNSNFNDITGELVISGVPVESGIFNYEITTRPCGIIQTGIMKISTPIAVTNEQITQVTCSGDTDGSISVDIIGGLDTNGLYSITWTGPDGFQQNQETITGLAPGTYTLTGNDAIGCPIPTQVYVIDDIEPVEINLISTTNQSCDGSLGCANFNFVGGTGIYTDFSLQYLDPSSQTLINVAVANNNYFNICDLQAGLYYLTIEDSNSCSSEPYLFSIYDYSSLNIESIQLDDSMCADSAGTIRVTVGSLDPNLTFYYNDELVIQEYLGDAVYELTINNPSSPTAIIKVTNDQNCWNSETINTTIEPPAFEYTSQNLTSFGSVAVNESVEFTNSVDLGDIPAEYDYVVWDFGDNSPFKVFFNPEDLAPNSDGDSFKTVFYTYAVDGIYTVSLSVYNRYGCSRTVSQTISVGRGANIIPPTAFSPNNDGVNDEFRPLLIGVTEVSMFIYDNWGNVVYEINSEVNALDSNWGWNGIETGKDVPENGTYRYYIRATSQEGEVIEKTGQMLLIK
jgi:gliding motility-associated-like protein